MVAVIKQTYLHYRQDGVLSTVKLVLSTLRSRLRSGIYLSVYRVKQPFILSWLRLVGLLSGSRSAGTVFVVPIVDTEGPSSTDIGSSWKKVDAMVEKVMSRSFRESFRDSSGRPVVISWFIVDWVGYKENPRRRILGHHRIFDHFQDRWLRKNLWKDGVYWHYHHSKSDGKWGVCTDWRDNNLYEKVLCRRIIDRNFFPSCYRGGDTMENNNSSSWLERWIPFDFSNRAPFVDDTANKIYDWHKAPSDWSIYHPATSDYQKRGSMKRWVARSIEAQDRRRFNEREVEKAFLRAQGGKDTILSFFGHEYKGLFDDFEYGFDLIRGVSSRYPQVKVRNATALEAMQKCVARESQPLILRTRLKNNVLEVLSNKKIFSPQPFLAVKDINNAYFRADLEKKGKNAWTFRFNKKKVESIGVGASDSEGHTFVAKIDLNSRVLRQA
jgi:hypothetical protein